MGPALGAEEADVGDVVLAAAVGAAGDVGADAADVGEAGLVEGGADGVGQAAALGDGEVAGVGARAGDDVAGQLGAGLGHADGGQALVEQRQLALGEAAEHEVLAVGDADLGAELALDRGQRPELGGGDVAEAGVGDGGHGALGDAADDVGVVPGLVRVVAAERDRGALARAGWASPRPRPAGASPCFCDGLGDAAGPGGATRRGTCAP